jgi:hypothetical protein
MKITLRASIAATVGLIAAGLLGVAGAAETTSTSTTTTTTTVTSTATPSPTTLSTAPPRTVAVQGVATEPVEISASAATATAVYRQAMAGAIADGQTKAQYLAAKAGATLGAVQSIAEGGGYIGCSGDLEYQGEQPDFGSSAAPGNFVAAPVTSRPARPVKPARRPKGGKHRSAKRAGAVAPCKLSTQVSLVFALS